MEDIIDIEKLINFREEQKDYPFNDFQKIWIEALESGDFKQGTGYLFDGTGYCCLGVGSAILGGKVTKDVIGIIETREDEESIAYPNEETVEKLGLRSMDASHDAKYVKENFPLEIVELFKDLDQYNDIGVSFKDIAAILRRYPECYFINHLN